KTLKETEALLNSPTFFRTHQSYLVNLNQIKEYIKGSGGQLVLQDGTIVQVARARKDALL
ncbi:MAG: DNA-binding response regulator, partial [Bacteroidetes bacterium]